MRNMSFSITTAQFLDGTKDVTRRLGWAFLKTGDLVQAVEKGMGLKKGEKVRRLGVIRILSVRREPLNFITLADVWREGFPHYSCENFIWLFKEANGCAEDAMVTRIEFERVPT